MDLAIPASYYNSYQRIFWDKIAILIQLDDWTNKSRLTPLTTEEFHLPKSPPKGLFGYCLLLKTENTEQNNF